MKLSFELSDSMHFPFSVTKLKEGALEILGYMRNYN